MWLQNLVQGDHITFLWYFQYTYSAKVKRDDENVLGIYATPIIMNLWFFQYKLEKLNNYE